MTTALHEPALAHRSALSAQVLSVCEWSKLSWVGKALGEADWLAGQSLLSVGTDERASWVDWERRGVGHSEGLSRFCCFWNSGLNCTIVLSLVGTNCSVGSTWWISSWVSCSGATLDLECPKGYWGRNLTYGVKWGTWIWEAGDAKLYMLCLYFLAELCVSMEVLRGYSTKPMLSAKRLLGLHNHGSISFSFS